MFPKLGAAVAAAAAACGVFAAATATAGQPTAAAVSDRCAYTFATPLQRLIAHPVGADVIGQSELAVTTTATAAFTPANVNVYVHAISDGAWQPSSQQLDEQIQVLNEAYASAGFTFQLARLDITNNPDWAAMTQGSQAEQQAKLALRKGAYRDINLYLVRPADGSRGWTTFPQALKGGKASNIVKQDGVVLNYETLPGGVGVPYNLGDTATHEVGHWLGLYHTYEGGCTGKGDRVDDTPAEAAATLGCPTNNPDTCPKGAGADPIHNFMDATDDACMYEFTPGQAARMQSIWTTLRNQAY